MQRVSDYVVRFIADQRVRHVFLVTGGGAMHLNDSLARCSEIEPICNSHEQASAEDLWLIFERDEFLANIMAPAPPDSL